MTNEIQIQASAEALGYALGQHEVDETTAMLVIEEMAFALSARLYRTHVTGHRYEVEEFTTSAAMAYNNREAELAADPTHTANPTRRTFEGD